MTSRLQNHCKIVYILPLKGVQAFLSFWQNDSWSQLLSWNVYSRLILLFLEVLLLEGCCWSKFGWYQIQRAPFSDPTTLWPDPLHIKQDCSAQAPIHTGNHSESLECFFLRYVSNIQQKIIVTAHFQSYALSSSMLLRRKLLLQDSKSMPVTRIVPIFGQTEPLSMNAAQIGDLELYFGERSQLQCVLERLIKRPAPSLLMSKKLGKCSLEFGKRIKGGLRVMFGKHPLDIKYIYTGILADLVRSEDANNQNYNYHNIHCITTWKSYECDEHGKAQSGKGCPVNDMVFV